MEITTITDISFIVVARNEEFSLRKCLSSLASMTLEDCEIICVDSGSTDNTLDIMIEFAKQNNVYQVFQCCGQLNSAIARNVGIEHASKKYIFFVDGDVELNQTFIVEALSLLRNSYCDAVTGGLEEYYYSDGYEQVEKRVSDRFNIIHQKRIYRSGGCFITRSDCVAKLGLWDERLDRNQDIDFTLRLSAEFKYIAIPISMGIHHTLGYQAKIIDFLLKLYPMYLGMILRKNLKTPFYAFELFKGNLGVLKGILFFVSVITSIIITSFTPLLGGGLLLFLASVLIADLIFGRFKGQRFSFRLVGHYLFAPLVVLGLFVDKPRKHTDVRISRVS